MTFIKIGADLPVDERTASAPKWGTLDMDDNGVRDSFETLLIGDPDVMDRDQLAEYVSQLGRVRNWCAAAEIRVGRRTKQLSAEGRSEPARAMLTDGGRTSAKDAHTASERETICGAMPSFEDALASGGISAAHVDALVSATRNLDDQLLTDFVACESDLVADAGRLKVESFERNCRALRAMHRTCAHPDCGVTFDNSRIHHVRFFRDGGPTSVDNMLPLCEQHHHLVHEGGWKLTMTPDRVATWQRRDGTVRRVESTITRRPAEHEPPGQRHLARC